MVDDTDRLLSRLSLGAGLEESRIISALDRLGISAPEDYVSFMSRSNGAEGAIGDAGYLVLWPVEKMEALNREYNIAEFAPGYVLFGSDGGDTAFAFSKTQPRIFFRMPFIGMSDHEAQPIGSTFIEFTKAIASPG